MQRREFWQSQLQKAATRRINGRTLAAFNANVDVIVHVTPESLSRLLEANPGVSPAEVNQSAGASEVHTKSGLIGVLKECLARGKSFHVSAGESPVLAWLDTQFPEAVRSMGGQAGIIGNQMAVLGAGSRVYTPLLSPQQARLFVGGVEAPVVKSGRLTLKPVTEAARRQDPTKINWIFEYQKGLAFRFGDETVTTPRANRVILASQPRAVMGFEPALRPLLGELGAAADVAFLAGYHHTAPQMPDGRDCETYLQDSVEDLRALCRGNPGLRLHYEYVSMKHEATEAYTLSRICSAVHSFGINEVEIKRVLGRCQFHAEQEAIEQGENAMSLYQGGLALLRHLNLERIQIHNLGYYVFVVRRPYPVPPLGIQISGLFGSAVNAMKARHGGYVTPERVAEAAALPLSDPGLEQIERFTLAADRLGLRAGEEGVWEGEDHWVLVVPAHIVPNPVSTVGMGDTISSATFAMEFQAGRAMEAVQRTP